MATKERRKTPPGAPKYHRLTDEKRIIIEALRKEGCSKKHIAERVGCHPTTVWRELKRNVSKKASSAQGYATSVALATGWRGITKKRLFLNIGKWLENTCPRRLRM